eukprot:310520_1
MATADVEIQTNQTTVDEEPEQHSPVKQNNRFLNYRTIEKIVSYSIVVLGLGAFSVPIYYVIATGVWDSNPFQHTNPNPYFAIVTTHVLIALVWGILLPFQLASGLFVRDIKSNATKDSLSIDIRKFKKYKKFHKLFGRFAPFGVFAFLSLAFVLIFRGWTNYEASFISVNFGAGLGMIYYFIWGMYYVHKNKQICQHRDCMMGVIVFSFAPATHRIIMYLFYLGYFIVYGEITYHPNPNLLVVFSATFILIIAFPLFYERP